MTCKYHKIRTKKGIKYGYCTLYKKEVDLFNCKCKSIERKMHNKSKNTVQKLKKRTYKLAKAEKNRYSIIYLNLDNCGICGDKRTDLHEVFGGAYRQASIKYGMVIPLCRKHHQLMHSNYRYALDYKIAFEERFLVNHSLEEFIKIFKIDYKNRK